MSTPAVTPNVNPPNQALPTWLRCGDQLIFAVQTQLPPGTLVFFVLTAVINNVPVRFNIGGAGTYSDPLAVLTDANGIATFTIAGTTTGAWQPGWYTWIGFSVDAPSTNNRSTLSDGTVHIVADPNGALIDPRSYNQKLLGAIRLLLQGKALDDAIMYKVGGRELTKVPIRDLMYWEAVVEGRCRREKIRNGQFVPTKTKGVTFGGRC